MKLLQTVIPIILNGNTEITNTDLLILIKLCIASFIVINIFCLIKATTAFIQVINIRAEERKYTFTNPTTWLNDWKSRMRDSITVELTKICWGLGVFCTLVYYIIKLL